MPNPREASKLAAALALAAYAAATAFCVASRSDLGLGAGYSWRTTSWDNNDVRITIICVDVLETRITSHKQP